MGYHHPKDNRMKKVLILLFAFFAVFGPLQAAEGDQFALKTLDGQTLKVRGLENGLLFDRYKGKIVFLEFWGTHCPPCRMSIPHYIELQKKYKDKLAIVAIEVQGTPAESLKAFVQSRRINYTVIPHQNAFDFIDYVARRSKWEGSIPYLIILDQQGNFVTGQVGLLSQDALEGVIKILGKSGTSQSAKPTKSPAPATTPSKENNASRQ
jgi:thiol-disulfide isomerase/thioredoxin